MCTCIPRPRLVKTGDGRWVCSVCHREPPPPGTMLRLVDFARDAASSEPDCQRRGWLDLREAV
ncbi:MAG: hypothetical protein U0166_00510 [Acidobacteriota bacterium]